MIPFDEYLPGDRLSGPWLHKKREKVIAFSNIKRLPGTETDHRNGFAGRRDYSGYHFKKRIL
jgi:hypothetical protein